MVGNNGKAYANRAMNESDLLIMVGARVADHDRRRPQGGKLGERPAGGGLRHLVRQPLCGAAHPSISEFVILLLMTYASS